jgi:hypothetical protein
MRLFECQSANINSVDCTTGFLHRLHQVFCIDAQCLTFTPMPCRYSLGQMLTSQSFDKELLLAAVGQQVPALFLEQSVYEIDCRQYLPRPLPYNEGMHTGCHPNLFSRVVKQENFRSQLEEIKLLLEDDKDMERTNVSVMLCDDLGRHGSMAIGKALAECIAADPTYTLGTVHILADQHSETYCGVCARCEFWSRRWTSRNQAVKAIKEMWFTPSE